MPNSSGIGYMANKKADLALVFTKVKYRPAMLIDQNK